MQDAAERSIKLGFLSTANWRERVGKTYSDDYNFEVAKKLRELNAIFKLTPEDWILLEKHFDCADVKWLGAVRDTNRQIGFQHSPADATEYVAALLSNLTGGVR
jgi:hypothetical protein